MFTQVLKFNEEPQTEFGGVLSLGVQCTSGPVGSFRTRVYDKVMSTWQDTPAERRPVSEEEINQVMMSVLKGKTLPNSMESIVFDFKVSGLPLVEITHLLRHRTIFGVHAQCTGDRDLRNDSYYMPPAVSRSTFETQYKDLVKKCVELYCKMVDSKEISIMDARYILPRAGQYFYYFSMNLKDAMAFIKQRRCTMIQPELDNRFAMALYSEIELYIPEIRLVLSPFCDKSCHYINSPDSLNTRLYKPDLHHLNLLAEAGKSSPTSVYEQTRQQMGGLL